MTSGCIESSRLPTATQLHNLPTILKGTLIERIHSMSQKKNTLFLFEINQYIRLNGKSNESSIAQTRLSIPLSNQHQVSHMRKITQYVLVDDSALTCHNSTLKIGSDYFLFLDKFNDKNFINHPIRTKNVDKEIHRKLFSNPQINIRDRRSSVVKLKARSKRIKQQQIQPLVVLVKVKILKSLLRPIEASQYINLPSNIQQIICPNCGKDFNPVKFTCHFLIFKRKQSIVERPVSLSISKEVHRANLHQNIKIFCSFSGNPEPEVFWKKYQQPGRIVNNNIKYAIEKIAKYV